MCYTNEVLRSKNMKKQQVQALVGGVIVLLGAVWGLSNKETAALQDIADALFQESSTSQVLVVSRVIDGDTIELSNGQKVRYIGINTPETKHPQKGAECFGQEAKEYNSALVLDKEVKLEKDVSETDRYGRLLRYVYIDEVLINEKLVADGYAYSSPYTPDVSKQEVFEAAEEKARAAKQGLWSSCQ